MHRVPPRLDAFSLLIVGRPARRSRQRARRPGERGEARSSSELLDANAFYAGTFDTWDADDDGLLSQDEFGLGTNAWLGGPVFGAFDDRGADDSGLIENDEF